VTERVVRFFRGDDVFISYARRDGVRYATGLARELTRRKLACRVDFWETVPGVEIPHALRRAIRRSGLLAVVGSPGACVSRQVAAEIEEFLPTRRNLVPIAVGESIERAIWFSMIDGLTVEQEPEPGALETGAPAESVVKRIEDSCDFVRRNTRLRRTFAATLAGTMVLVTGASVWSTLSFIRATQAEDRARNAEARVATAEGRVKNATETAALQERLASARQISLELDARRTEIGYTRAADVPTAVQALRQLLSLGQQVEAGAAFATSLAELPRLHSKMQVDGLGHVVTSIDGRWVAASVDGTTVLVWETPSLREAGRFRFNARVTALAFSVDSSVLAAGSGSRAAVFDLPSTSPSMSVQFPMPVSRLSLSPNRGYVAGVSDEDIYIWSKSEGRLWTIPAEGEVDALAFSADGSHLAATVFEQGFGHVLLLVNLDTGESRRDPVVADSGVLLSLSPDGRFVSAWCEAEPAPRVCPTRLWSLPTLVPYAQLPTRDISTATFSPDGSHVATAENGQTRIWDSLTGLLLGVVPDRGEVVFSSDGRTVAISGRRGITSVSSTDGLVSAVLDRRGSDPRIGGGQDWNLSGVTSEGRYAVLANPESGEVEVWLMEGVDRVPGFEHDGDVAETVLSAGGNLLVVSTVAQDFMRSDYATLWDVETGQRLLHVGVADLPASSRDQRVTVFRSIGDDVDSIAARRAGRMRPGADPRVSSVARVPSGRLVGLRRERTASATLLSLWDLTRGVNLASVQVESARGERFTEDEAYAFSVATGTLMLLDRNGGRMRTVSKPGGQLANALCAPEAGCLAAFRTERGLQVWNLDRDESVLEIPGPAGLAALSPDGRHAAVVRSDAIEVWEIEGKRPLARRPALGIAYLGFASDGRRLIAGMGRRVQFWTWRPDDLFRSVCARLEANAGSSAWASLLSSADVDRACN
jgi:WD40 repeat protein